MIERTWCGLELVLRSLPEVRLRCPDLRLRIIGEGLPGYQVRLQELAREQGLEDCVEFLGQRAPEELPELLAAADLSLANSEPVPFRQFACPLKVLESMAVKLSPMGLSKVF